MGRSSDRFTELARLFFETRHIMRSKVPGGKKDPNAWMRSEALRFVAEHEQPGMKDIAEFLRIKAPSATSLVAHLEREGLVARRACDDDRRIVRIALTGKGRQAVESYEKKSARIMREVFGKLEPGELRDLEAAMRRVAELHAPPQSAIMRPHDRRGTQGRAGA